MKKKKRNERERRSGGVYIYEKFGNITSCHWDFLHAMRLASLAN